MPALYAYEWIAVGYFALLGGAALAAPLPGRRRADVLLPCLFLIVLIAALAQPSPRVLMAAMVGPVSRETARIWLPVAYVLLGYWLPARLYRAPMPSLEARLLDTDRRIDAAIGLDRLVARSPRALLEYLELSYALTYIFLPAGLALVLLSGRGDLIPRFWTVALLSHLGAYAALLVVQTRPPWALEGPRAIDARPLACRRLNRFIVRHGSNCINTLPSGHASGAMGVALVLFGAHAGWGSIVVVLAISIAVAAYVGRYHYAIDVVTGVAVGWLAWMVVV